MAMISTRWSELTKLMADHVLIHRNGNELVAIIDAERQANELRQDCRATRPSLDRRSLRCFLSGFCFFQQIEVNKRTFPDGTRHELPLLLSMPRTDDHPFAA
eukprot:gene13084-17405_t